ncbi:hypothetical protein CFAM422_008840 [Trichoderma lentiforme]|uniref:Uncharacterized protein n=1 Tax=Trichoderma lentiforme TaxID=1567552 RepID=A0A9P4XA41_9HYPO|nr:hypothetical protein CFAM422_008840 [Trichoderma lentiforme]
MTLLKPQRTPRTRGDSVSSNASFRSAISFHSDTSYQSATSFVAVGYAEAVEPPGHATSPNNTASTARSRRDSTTMSSGAPFHSDNITGPSNPNPISSTPSGGSASSVHPHHSESTNSNPFIDSTSPSISTTSSTTDDESVKQQDRNGRAHSD